MINELLELKKRLDQLMNELLFELREIEKKLNEAKIEDSLSIATDHPDYKLSWELYETDFKFKIFYKGSRCFFEDCDDELQVEMFRYLPLLINRLQNLIKSRINKLENVKKQLEESFD